MEVRSLGLGCLTVEMPDISRFESRTAMLSCSTEEFYSFITDIRNFGKFIPEDAIKNWQAGEDSCMFTISPMGEVTLKIAEKRPHSLVKFSGKVLVTTGFSLTADINQDHRERASVKLVMEAELNPMLRMFASGPIEQFLGTLADEMEKFGSWRK